MKTIEELLDEEKHLRTMASSYDTEYKLLLTAANLTKDQMESADENGDEETVECLLPTLTELNRQLEIVEEKYFESCAEYWIIQSEISELQKNQNGNS